MTLRTISEAEYSFMAAEIEAVRLAVLQAEADEDAAELHERTCRYRAAEDPNAELDAVCAEQDLFGFSARVDAARERLGAMQYDLSRYTTADQEQDDDDDELLEPEV